MEPTAWATPAPIRLVTIERDGSEGRAYPVTDEVTLIGRSGAGIVFADDAFVSPIHARLERAPDGTLFLVDAGSRNGVYLRITRAEAVYPGDQFLVGHHLLRLENAPGVREEPADAEGTRAFGTPIEPPWGVLALVGRGGAVGDTFFLRTPQVVIGREEGELVFCHDRFMSRAHARLVLHVDGPTMEVRLEDMGSANGTYLRLRGRAKVGPNDTFRVGDKILRIKVD